MWFYCNASCNLGGKGRWKRDHYMVPYPYPNTGCVAAGLLLLHFNELFKAKHLNSISFFGHKLADIL